jgi:hypothetical protein
VRRCSPPTEGSRNDVALLRAPLTDAGRWPRSGLLRIRARVPLPTGRQGLESGFRFGNATFAFAVINEIWCAPSIGRVGSSRFAPRFLAATQAAASGPSLSAGFGRLPQVAGCDSRRCGWRSLAAFCVTKRSHDFARMSTRCVIVRLLRVPVHAQRRGRDDRHAAVAGPRGIGPATGLVLRSERAFASCGRAGRSGGHDHRSRADARGDQVGESGSDPGDHLNLRSMSIVPQTCQSASRGVNSSGYRFVSIA